MKKILYVVCVVATFFPLNVLANGIAFINTQWLWDHRWPHEGKVLKSPPGQREYLKEISAYSRWITSNKFDIVGFAEIENKYVLTDISDLLGPDYNYVFVNGRDGYTGQDVGLVTTKHIKPNTPRTIDVYGQCNGVSKRVSKGLSVVLDNSFVVLVHLLSRKSANDSARCAQANAIVKHVQQFQPAGTELIILGDFNDTNDSEVLKILTTKLKLKNYANPGDWSYIYRNKRDLIDHILVSGDVQRTFKTHTMKPYSDHKAISLH